jgi:hypothetical protein
MHHDMPQIGHRRSVADKKFDSCFLKKTSRKSHVLDQGKGKLAKNMFIIIIIHHSLFIADKTT